MSRQPRHRAWDAFDALRARSRQAALASAEVGRELGWFTLYAAVSALLWAIGWWIAWMSEEGLLDLEALAWIAPFSPIFVAWVASWFWLVHAGWSGEPLIKPGGAVPRRWVRARVLYLVLVTVVGGLTVFSLGTYFLVNHDLIRITSAEGEPLDDYLATSKLFLWQFLEIIPLAGLNEALKWDEPGSERDTAAGMVVAAYILVILIPVVATITGAFRHTTPHGSESQEPSARPVQSGRSEEQPPAPPA